MAVRRVLARLLRLRELEEEQRRLELEAAVGERNQMAQEMSRAEERQARGRKSFVAGLGEPDSAGRFGGVMEMEHARRLQQLIEPRLVAAEDAMLRRREVFLTSRTGRRQVEILVERQEETERESAMRRAQQMLDDWYGRRVPKTVAGAGNGAGSKLRSEMQTLDVFDTSDVKTSQS
jgi:flagellar export protein FliJ